MKAINPATNEVIKEYTEHAPDEIIQIIDQAHEEYLKWRQVGFDKRAKLMHKAAGILRPDRPVAPSPWPIQSP